MNENDRTAVYLELGAKRVFACALEWPGWCRAGRREAQALETLASYAPRYAPVAAEAGITFPDVAGQALEVVERLKGTATTDFGAPDRPASRDLQPLTRDGAERLVALMRAAWAVLDRVVLAAPPELRKGPRGGGRDRDAVVAHILGAETSYARQLGIRMRQPELADAPAVSALRDTIVEVLLAIPRQNPAPATAWPPSYAVRRIAWHVLDHAWEIEDRAQ